MKMKWLASLAVVLGACPSVTVDDNEGVAGPTVEFDPANRIIPFPNNLLLDRTTGRLALPEGCNETPASAATRAALNKLDGFGTYQPTINVTFTEPVDAASLAGRVLLYQRVRMGTTLDPLTASPIPVVAIAGKTTRFRDQSTITACADPVMVDQITFVPTRPLDQRSTYTVALLAGIRTEAGATFAPSFTWSLIRHPEPVVAFDAAGNLVTNRTPLDPYKTADRAQLEGIDLLWRAHHDAVRFLAGTGHDSDELLLAFEFNTQTTTAPLDPEVAGSPASTPTALPLLGNQSAVAIAAGRAGAFAQCIQDDPIPDTQCFLRVLLGAGNYTVGRALCAAAGCAAINDVLGSLLLSKQYVTDVMNTGYTGTGARPVPGAWTDPVEPTVVHDTNDPNPLANDPAAQLDVLVVIPQGTAPAAGWPTVIFQHGITRSRNDAFALAGNLASQGFAVVAIDAVNHGSRAVRISDDADAGCGDVNVGIPGPRPDRGPDPTSRSGCYAPVFSADLAATRDAFRQTVLDLQQLVTALKACATPNLCGKLHVDPARIGYVGHSLIGGNLGVLALATTELPAGVLDGAGAGWLDILENTDQTVAFQCPLVDALIASGVLSGAPYDPDAETGLCTTDAWKAQPGYRQFAAIGRWMLDPADPANFARRLATRRFLLQRIDDDEVVPDTTTDNLGELANQLRADASCGIPIGASVPPSTTLLAAPTQSHFLDHVTRAPLDPECPVGNTFTHGSLLQPAPSVTGLSSCDQSTGAGCDGLFATVRLQTDAIYFLLSNLAN
jgi:dienelactone hydrolase